MQKLDIDLMSNIIRQVVSIYGHDILLHEPQFRAAIKDCMGADMSSLEGKLLIFTSEIGLGLQFFQMVKDGDSGRQELDAIRIILETQYGFKAYRIEELINAYCMGLNMGIFHIKQSFESFKCKHSYGVRYTDNYLPHRAGKLTKINNLILKDEEAPIKKEFVSSKLYDGALETVFFIYESDSRELTYEPEEGKLLGLIRLSYATGSRSGTRTRLEMSIDSFGIMHLKLTDLVSGVSNIKTINLS